MWEPPKDPAEPPLSSAHDALHRLHANHASSTPRLLSVSYSENQVQTLAQILATMRQAQQEPQQPGDPAEDPQREDSSTPSLSRRSVTPVPADPMDDLLPDSSDEMLLQELAPILEAIKQELQDDARQQACLSEQRLQAALTSRVREEVGAKLGHGLRDTINQIVRKQTKKCVLEELGPAAGLLRQEFVDGALRSFNEHTDAMLRDELPPKVRHELEQAMVQALDMASKEVVELMELFKTKLLEDVGQASRGLTEEMLRIELTPRVRQEMGAMLSQELHGKVRTDMQAALRGELAGMVRRVAEEWLAQALPDLREKLRRDCIAAAVKEAGRRLAKEQQERAAARQEVATLVRTEMAALRAEMRDSEARVSLVQTQRMETLETFVLPDIVSRHFQSLQPLCPADRDIASSSTTAALLQGNGVEVESDNSDDLSRRPKRKTQSPPPVCPPTKRTTADPYTPHFLRWGLMTEASGLRAGAPGPDPVLLGLLGTVPPSLWDPAALEDFVAALVSGETAARHSGAMERYLEALHPHLDVLPEALQVTLRQLRAVADLLHGDPAAATDPSDSIDRIVGVWPDTPLTGWALPLATLVAVLQPLVVTHLRATPPRHAPPVALLSRLAQALASAPITPEEKSCLLVVRSLLTDPNGLIDGAATDGPADAQDDLQRSVRWCLERGGGTLPAKFFAEFVAPLCINLPADRSGLTPRSLECWRADAFRTLRALRMASNPDTVTAVGIPESSHPKEAHLKNTDLKEADLLETHPTETEYFATLRWLVIDGMGLHAEDPMCGTGVVGPRPVPCPLVAPEMLQLLAHNEEVVGMLHRILAEPPNVDYARVAWTSRACCQLRSDQLLKLNEPLQALHRTVTSRYTSEPAYEIRHPRVVNPRRRQETLEKVKAFFDSPDTSAFFNPTGVAVRQIGQEDPRVGLRGQFGLFCSEPGGLPAYHILGVYVGQLLTNQQYEELRLPLPAKLQRGRYCYGVQVMAGNEQLTIDSLETGNQLMVINDCRTEPYLGDEFDSEPNVRFVEVTRNGWPHVFVETTKKIKFGTEFLMDYGSGYWDGHRLLRDQLGAVLLHHRAAAAALAPLVTGTRQRPVDLD